VVVPAAALVYPIAHQAGVEGMAVRSVLAEAGTLVGRERREAAVAAWEPTCLGLPSQAVAAPGPWWRSPQAVFDSAPASTLL
jgi:hypothetical protein